MFKPRDHAQGGQDSWQGLVKKEQKSILMKYLFDEEDDLMLKEFWEFDREMIHEKYRSVLHNLEE